jgi:hypothetical protein
LTVAGNTYEFLIRFWPFLHLKTLICRASDRAH